MRETVTEYGLILVACIVTVIVLGGAFAIFTQSDAWKTFVDLYADVVFSN